MSKKKVPCALCGMPVGVNKKVKTCKRCRETLDKMLKQARLVILNRDEHTCIYCGKKPLIPVLDHVIPYPRSHDNSAYNLVTSCSLCNLLKGNSLLPQEEYIEILNRNIRLNQSIPQDILMMIKLAFDMRGDKYNNHIDHNIYEEEKGVIPYVI